MLQILMRIGGKAPPLPENVMAVSWLPQNDVLGESNLYNLDIKTNYE